MPRDNENRQTQHMNTSPSAFSCPFPPEGCEFGRYRGMSVIGEGGMGRVFKAFDPMLDMDLAVKVIPRGMHASDEERKRFMREIRLLAGLTLPGVVRLFDCGECNGWQYYTMELLEGKTLDRYIEDNDLSMEQSLGYIQKLAHILQSIHDQGIIHRDLKPSNIIITEDGDIRLTDFGIAKQFAEDREDSGITMHNSRPGTPYYMSPDPSNVLKDLLMAKKADVYSLAVMAYELVTGRFPYDIENLTATECILVIREEPPYSFKDRNVAIPLDIEILIMSALDKDPLKRPDAGDFGDRLEKLLHRGSDSGKPRQAKPVIKWVVACAAGVLLVIAAQQLLMQKDTKHQNNGAGNGGTQTVSNDGSDSQVASVVGDSDTTTSDTGTISSVASSGDGNDTITDAGEDDPDATTVNQQTGSGQATGEDGVTAGNNNDQDPNTEVEVKPTPEMLFAAALAQAEEYLGNAQWSEAETAFLSLQKIPGYEVCEEAPDGVRKAKRGRLIESANTSAAEEDWDTVKALTADALALMPNDPEALKLQAQAVEALKPVLTVTVWNDGREVKGASIYLDSIALDGTSPVSVKIDRQGKHIIRVVAPRTKDTLYLPYRADFYMADRPLEMKVKLQALKTLTVNDIHMDMVPVAAGEFKMGGATDVRGQAGTHVTLTRHFWMSRYEVNQDQYYTILRSNPSPIRGERYPVSRVSWNNAMSFCRALTLREKKSDRLPDGYIYRLPTEAEWEYVCKAGTGLNRVVMADDSAGVKVNCAESGRRQYAEVGFGQPNKWGIYNMPGNVREWVWDGYSTFVKPRAVNPVTPPSGNTRLVKGGSWRNRIRDCTSLSRDRSTSPNKGYSDVGFRIVLAPAVQ